LNNPSVPRFLPTRLTKHWSELKWFLAENANVGHQAGDRLQRHADDMKNKAMRVHQLLLLLLLSYTLKSSNNMAAKLDRRMANSAQQFTSTIHHDTYPEISKSDHRGHSVLITGASKGIGRATALCFAKGGASTICIAARSSLDEVERAILSVALESAPKVVKIQLDVASESSVAEAARIVEKEVGQLDILVNNAGYLESFVPIADSDPAEWWKSWETNMKGVYLMTRAFLPILLRGGQKTIVNIGSVGALNIRPGASGYQITKLAVMRFAEYTASEYGDQGLVVFTMHPGGIMTELAQVMPKEAHSVLIDTVELAADSIAWLTQTRREWLSGRYVSANWHLPDLLEMVDDIVEGDKLKLRLAQ
jgi:NAD(P)-dependent dehydrogenase (short-subunit alcohol dehydrogenase family)